MSTAGYQFPIPVFHAHAYRVTKLSPRNVHEGTNQDNGGPNAAVVTWFIFVFSCFGAILRARAGCLCLELNEPSPSVPS